MKPQNPFDPLVKLKYGTSKPKNDIDKLNDHIAALERRIKKLEEKLEHHPED